MTAQITIAMAQANPTVGDVAGNLAMAAPAARARSRGGRRTRRAARAGPRGLPARGPGAEAGRLQEALPRGGRGARRATPPTAARRCSSARPGARAASSTTPVAARRRRDRGRALQASICPTTACSTRSASSRRPDAGAGGSFRGRAHRRAWSARTCGPPTSPSACARRGAEILHRAQRLALRASASTDAAHAARASSASPRPACRSSTSTRSAARTSWCSTAARSCWTPTAALKAQLPASREDAGDHALAARRRAAGAASTGPIAPLERRHSRPIYQRDGAGPARLRRQERLSRRGARPVGRHRFGARRPRSRSTRWGRSACTA